MSVYTMSNWPFINYVRLGLDNKNALVRVIGRLQFCLIKAKCVKWLLHFLLLRQPTIFPWHQVPRVPEPNPTKTFNNATVTKLYVVLQYWIFRQKRELDVVNWILWWKKCFFSGYIELICFLSLTIYIHAEHLF